MSNSENPEAPSRSRFRECSVADDEGGLRLDRWFKRHHPGLPHARLAKLLRTGQVRLDGKRAKPGDRIEAGQVIRLPPFGDAPHPIKARQSLPLDPVEEDYLHSLILHRDDAVLALNKPSGLAVQGGSKLTRHLDGWLDALRFGAVERPRLVHRLDKDTSGVLLIGRTASAAAALAQTFRGRAAHKLYWALVCREPRPLAGRINLALLKREEAGGEQVVADQQGRRAVTLYQTVETAGGKAAWLALKPLTGRTHQLRVHCAALGCPIQGDGKYGNRDLSLGGLVPAKLHLHAREIILPHPDGGELRVTAPLTGHMAESWRLFDFDPETVIPAFDEKEK